jgi:hypothetical protein
MALEAAVQCSAGHGGIGPHGVKQIVRQRVGAPPERDHQRVHGDHLRLQILEA